MVFESFLNPIFNPLLGLHPALIIAIISFIATLIITLVYKYTTDQNLMKQLKSEMKELQKQAKELRAHPEKAMKIQKKSMETNMKYMTISMKSTLYTMLPILIIFGWLNAHIAYVPVDAGQEFTIDAQLDKAFDGMTKITVPNGLNVIDPFEKNVIDSTVSWKLAALERGTYFVTISTDRESFDKEVLIDEKLYAKQTESYKGGDIKKISVGYKKNKPLSLGSFQMGWLLTYILFSIIFSTALRKIMKVY